ncbi:MAG: hypothetical protein ACERKV_07255 [Clostridiaceae bacterium]
MITERDKDILRWIEEHKSITINQCSKLFYTGNKFAYDQARKRLRYLNKENLIKRYRQDPKSETIYFTEKRLKIHGLKLMDVIAALKEFNVYDIKKERKIGINSSTSYIVDSTCVLKYSNALIPVIVEIDYTHYTNSDKIENLITYVERKNKIGCIFIIVKPTTETITVENIGAYSRLVMVNWEFHKKNELSRSLRSLLEEDKLGLMQD